MDHTTYVPGWAEGWTQSSLQCRDSSVPSNVVVLTHGNRPQRLIESLGNDVVVAPITHRSFGLEELETCMQTLAYLSPHCTHLWITTNTLQSSSFATVLPSLLRAAVQHLKCKHVLLLTRNAARACVADCPEHFDAKLWDVCGSLLPVPGVMCTVIDCDVTGTGVKTEMWRTPGLGPLLRVVYRQGLRWVSTHTVKVQRARLQAVVKECIGKAYDLEPEAIRDSDLLDNFHFTNTLAASLCERLQVLWKGEGLQATLLCVYCGNVNRR